MAENQVQVQNLIQEIPVTQAIEKLTEELKKYGINVTYINIRGLTEIIIHMPKNIEMPIYTGFTGIIEYNNVNIHFDRTTCIFSVLFKDNGIVYEFKDVIPLYEDGNVLKIFACYLSKAVTYDTNKIIDVLLTM